MYNVEYVPRVGIQVYICKHKGNTYPASQPGAAEEEGQHGHLPSRNSGEGRFGKGRAMELIACNCRYKSTDIVNFHWGASKFSGAPLCERCRYSFAPYKNIPRHCWSHRPCEAKPDAMRVRVLTVQCPFPSLPPSLHRSARLSRRMNVETWLRAAGGMF